MYVLGVSESGDAMWLPPARMHTLIGNIDRFMPVASNAIQ